jgi:hypothetical protein
VIEPTDEMERAYKRARKAVKEAAQVMNCSEHGMGDCPYHQVPGAARRAGLAAVLAIVERDRCLQPRGHVFHPLRNWPPGRGGSHPHYCVSCSTGAAPGAGCGNCRSTGMDQTPWPDCADCRVTRSGDARQVAP